MGTPEVDVIIPNWNGRDLLARCLPAVLGQVGVRFGVIVVDNGSVDGSIEVVRRLAPQARIVANPTNRGFAAAVNQGIRAATAPYIATLNNDAVPDRAWLGQLLAAAADPTVGACASKMLFADRPDVINSAGIAVDRAGIAWDRLGGAPADTADATRPAEVFGACAGAALYRRAMLEDIDLFDEAFFAYLEDVDLAWRARLAGWRAVYVPEARVWHQHSATAGEGSPLKSRLLGRNKWWTIVKCYPSPDLLHALPAILLYDVLSVAHQVLIRRNFASLAGRLEALAGLRRCLEQRRGIQARATMEGLAACRRLLEPIATPAAVLARYRHLPVKTGSRASANSSSGTPR